MEALKMCKILFLKEVPFSEMGRILRQGTDFTTDLIRANRAVWCLSVLTISFTLFLLILSILYINPNFYITCESKKPENYVLQILSSEPSSNLALERYAGLVLYDEIITTTDLNFFPDVNDIEIRDDINDFLECPLLQSNTESTETVDREALTSVKMALKLKQMNNLDKAQKLFQHAIALSPNHHDVLLHYGEFLESGKDFINADYFYLKAIMIGPENTRALTNRRRTLPVVNQIDLEELKRIDSKRRELVRLNNKDPSLKRLKKEIYFQHIHHTVAIEGNTMSLAETRTVVETKMVVSGKSILEHNEILGMESALRYLNQTLADKNGITVADILEIHRRVMGHVDPTTAGTFRKSQVFVGEHTPPAASDVEVLMDEFVALLQSSHIRNMHPIHIAAFAHYKLVFIHPFLDGNGRTARLLMNLLFIKNGYPPIIIRKEERAQYYKFLQIANDGDRRPFYRFIARSTEYTIDAFLHAHELKKPTPIKCLESSKDIKDVIPL